MFTLRQLQYFLALAELRHFSKAAERCCVTQPALSMQIKELEDALGMQLVVRQRGHIDLTTEGKAILARARSLLSMATELSDFAQHRQHTLVGELRLGIIPSVAPYLFPKIMLQARARYPKLQLKLHELLTHALFAELAAGSLDAAVLALPVGEPELASIHLFEDAFLLARRRTPRRGQEEQKIVRIDSLRGEKLLLLNEGHCLRDQTLSYCSWLKPELLSEFGASSLSTIMRMVANGYGVTLLPQIAADSELFDPRIELLRFAPPEPHRALGLAWHHASTRAKDYMALGALIIEVQKSAMFAAQAGATTGSHHFA